jgi:hypothetical protein
VNAVWKGRAIEVAARYGEHAPMAAACCNACRTCTTTNVLGLAMAGATAAGVAILGVARRLTTRA